MSTQTLGIKEGYHHPYSWRDRTERTVLVSSLAGGLAALLLADTHGYQQTKYCQKCATGAGQKDPRSLFPLLRLLPVPSMSQASHQGSPGNAEHKDRVSRSQNKTKKGHNGCGNKQKITHTHRYYYYSNFREGKWSREVRYWLPMFQTPCYTFWNSPGWSKSVDYNRHINSLVRTEKQVLHMWTQQCCGRISGQACFPEKVPSEQSLEWVWSSRGLQFT